MHPLLTSHKIRLMMTILNQWVQPHRSLEKYKHQRLHHQIRTISKYRIVEALTILEETLLASEGSKILRTSSRLPKRLVHKRLQLLR